MKGIILNAVINVWNFPPPSTERKWTIMNIKTNAVATNLTTIPENPVKNAK